MEACCLSWTFGILSLIPWLPNIAQFQVHPGILDFRSGRDLEISEADHFKFQRRKLKADGGQMTCLQCSCRKLLAESGPESTSSNKRKRILTSTLLGFGINSSLKCLGCWSWVPPSSLPHWFPSLSCTAPLSKTNTQTDRQKERIQLLNQCSSELKICEEGMVLALGKCSEGIFGKWRHSQNRGLEMMFFNARSPYWTSQ